MAPALLCEGGGAIPELRAMIGTLAELKDCLSVNFVDDDALLTRLLEAASGIIVGQTGRAFGEVTYPAERHLGEGGTILALDHGGVAAVTEVRVAGEVIPPATNAAVDDGWFLVGDRVCLRGNYRFTTGALVEVTYSAGEPAPAEIVQAAYELAMLKYRERQHVGQSSQTMAGQSVSYLPAIIPQSVQAVLDIYRLPRF